MKTSLLLTLLAACALIGGANFAFRGTGTHKLPSYGKLPAIELRDDKKAQFAADDLMGRITLLQFFFTSCHGPCPLAVSQFAKLTRDLGESNQQLQFLSVTVDPERDTPAVLAEFRTRLGLDARNWRFLTGTPEAIKELAAACKVAADKEIHSTKVILIDPERSIRGYYDLNEPEQMTKLQADLGEI